MKLECQKYNEEMVAGDAACRHPNDYCKYRTSCIIQFMEKENKQKSTKQGVETPARQEESDKE